MRNLLWSIVVDYASEFGIPESRVIQSASADEHYEKPFLVVKCRGVFPSVSKKNGGGMVGAEIWVHDSYGSYDRINTILTRIRRGLFADAPVYGAGGSFLACIDWESESPDLNDDGYGTICRMISVNLVGRDAA